MADAGPGGAAPVATGRRGAVVAPHGLASAAGLAILRAGGGAVDAAIATNAVLAVVEPNHCGLGGDAFWLIWDAAAGRQLALNGSGRSPAGMDAAGIRARGLEVVPARGPLAITIPGAVRSWADAHRRFGRLSRTAVLEPAIQLADRGFPAWDGFVASVERAAPLVAAALGPGAGFFEVYRPGGRAWRLGEAVRLPALAATLRRLAEDGFDAFYDGDLGARQATALAGLGLPVTAADFRDHASTWVEPISTTYRGVTVTGHPPNASSLVALELLNVLEQFDPPADVAGSAWIHLGIEASKLAMADRDAWLTDPEAHAIPVEELLGAGHAAELAAQIDPRRASRPAPTIPAGGGTVYLAAVDGEGNAVSLIESNYMGFGSGVVDPATGIHYQNRGSYFSLQAGHPNELAPRKRTLHTLMPGMLFAPPGPGGPAGPWVVAGSMGGDAQPQIHAQLVSALVDGGLDISTAVTMPRWFVEPERHFAPPIRVRLEPRFRPGVLEQLAERGHPVSPTAPFDDLLGHEHAIQLLDGGPGTSAGSLIATTDPRSAGRPAAW